MCIPGAAADDSPALGTGYSIEDLCRACEFEEVAYLLIYGDLPTPAQLKSYRARLNEYRVVPKAVRVMLEHIPLSANPMDVLRSTCSMLGCLRPETGYLSNGGEQSRYRLPLPLFLVVAGTDDDLAGQSDKRVDR